VLAENVITVDKLVKVFYSRKKEGVRSLFRKKEEIVAVNNVSFKVKKGEIFGYLGENGSGKTTTIKMLTGILTPTSGSARVLGFVPWERKNEYLKQIGVVFGVRSILFWDIPAIEAFRFYRDVYEVPPDDFEERLEYFDSILNVKKLAKKPVRKMSLGERMKCSLVAALIHYPKIVFLDEPTIGLDAVSKEAVRDFIRDFNKRHKLTVMLTTHDVLDVEALCTKVILLDKGRKIFQGTIPKLKKSYLGYKILYVEYNKIKNKPLLESVLRMGRLIGRGTNWVELEVKTDGRLPKTVAGLLKAVNVVDLDVKEPGLDRLLVKVYGEKK